MHCRSVKIKDYCVLTKKKRLDITFGAKHATAPDPSWGHEQIVLCFWMAYDFKEIENYPKTLAVHQNNLLPVRKGIDGRFERQCRTLIDSKTLMRSLMKHCTNVMLEKFDYAQRGRSVNEVPPWREKISRPYDNYSRRRQPHPLSNYVKRGCH